MTTIEALILGAIQGLTEFLPISSSGHLVLFQHLFGFKEPELLFDICLHVGTLSAVILVFFHDLREILAGLFQLPGRIKMAGGPLRLIQVDPASRMVLLIAAGSLPTAIIGLLFKTVADRLFSSVFLVGMMLLITGTLLWLTRRIQGEGRPIARTTVKDALIIGVVQGLAILPGISRSGSTIATALFLGVDRQLAGRFSFLLSIPAIVGALILELRSPVLKTTIPWGTILGGSLVAAVVGWLALRMLLRVVDRGQLHRFSPYCWLVGAITLLVAWLG